MKKLLFFFTAIFTIGICNGQPIDTTEIVNIGGIRQFISIKGGDRKAPVLLFLHGGPGRSLMPFADKFTNKLQQKFVVVQWDQREVGETLKLNTSTAPLSVGLLKSDTHEVVEYLLKRFGRKKLYLVGHSFGTVLGFYIADKYPQLLYAYIPISPVVDQIKSNHLTLAMLQKQAKKDNNTQELKELATIKIPFENTEQLFYFSKWLFIYNDVDFAKKDDFKEVYIPWATTWMPVWSEATKNNLFKTLKAVKCPVYFFVGRGDNQTFFNISEAYFKALKAPKKKLFWFEKSGHTIFTTEPDRLQDLIIDKILPQTF